MVTRVPSSGRMKSQAAVKSICVYITFGYVCIDGCMYACGTVYISVHVCGVCMHVCVSVCVC